MPATASKPAPETLTFSDGPHWPDGLAGDAQLWSRLIQAHWTTPNEVFQSVMRRVNTELEAEAADRNAPLLRQLRQDLIHGPAPLYDVTTGWVQPSKREAGTQTNARYSPFVDPAHD